MQAEKLLQVNSHFQLQYEESQKCFVLLYPEGMVQLNQSAGEIMNLCTGELTAKEIVKALEEKFNVDNLKNDVDAFVKEAFTREWLEYNE